MSLTIVLLEKYVSKKAIKIRTISFKMTSHFQGNIFGLQKTLS